MSSESAHGANAESLRVPSSDSPRQSSSSLKRNYSGKKEAMNGPLYRQTVNNTVLVRRLKRKGDGPSKQLARWFVENQIGTPLILFPPLFSQTHPQQQSKKGFSKVVRATPPAIVTLHCMLRVSSCGVATIDRLL